MMKGEHVGVQGPLSLVPSLAATRFPAQIKIVISAACGEAAAKT